MRSNPSITEKERFPFIDGMRGIAILLVIFHHGFYNFQMPILIHSSALQGIEKLLYIIARNGYWGVHFFFIISGFLITGLLMGFIVNKLDLARFYNRRIFKIIPHYYFIIGIIFIPLIALNFNGISSNPGLFFSYLFFLQNYNAGVPWLDHTWSLVVEEQFYIFWSIYLYFLSKRFNVENVRWQAAIIGAGIILSLVTVNRYFLYRNGISLMHVYPMKTHVTHASSVLIDGLMVGSILRLIWYRYSGSFKNKNFAYIIYWLGICAITMLFIFPSMSWGVPKFWYSADLAWLASACFIIAGLGGATLGLESSWLRWIGRSSYGIYLTHYPLLLLLQSFFQKSGYGILIIYTILAIGLGTLTTATIENYFLELRKKIAP